MERDAYRKIVSRSRTPEAVERTIAYLTEHLSRFVREGEYVLICFPYREQGSLSWFMEQAVLRCNAVPVVWADHLWKTLLRQAFTNRVTAIIGPPLILLGLMKLKQHNSTPLYIRRVVIGGYPCPDWMVDGLVKGFDCELGGCLSLEHSGIVAGFSCGHSGGVHLREDVYGVDIVDDQGSSVPVGTTGQIVLYPKEEPQLRLPLGDYAVLNKEKCACGRETVRLNRLRYGGLMDPELDALAQTLLTWNSILDCHVKRGEYGLELEIVCFRGEKLPKLPTAAKLQLRPWDPQSDTPLMHVSSLKIPEMM